MKKFGHVIDDNCGGDEIIGGYPKRLVIMPTCGIKKYPVRETSPEGLKDICTHTGTFEFHEDKQPPMVIDVIPGSVNYKADPQGEIGSESFKPSGSFRMKDKREADGLAKFVMNTPCVMVIPEHNETEQFFVGNKNLPCKITAGFDSGTGASDARGYTFNYEAEASFVPKQYLASPMDIDALAEGTETV